MRPVQVASEIRVVDPVADGMPLAPPVLPTLSLLGVLFLTTLVFAWVLRPARADLGRSNVHAADIHIGIDPNTAQWFELAQLPGVGESLARKIVVQRESRRAANPGSDRPIFETGEHLLPIPGIGPRTMARLRPFLRFPPPSSRFDSVSPNR